MLLRSRLGVSRIIGRFSPGLRLQRLRWNAVRRHDRHTPARPPQPAERVHAWIRGHVDCTSSARRMDREPLRFVILGLSITSSYENGHAAAYRGLVKELA